MNPYITCRQLIEFLADYLDGELDPGQRREFDRHLAVCPSCVNYLESYKAAVAMGKAAFCAPPDAPAPGVPEELVTAILAARRQRAP